MAESFYRVCNILIHAGNPASMGWCSFLLNFELPKRRWSLWDWWLVRMVSDLLTKYKHLWLSCPTVCQWCKILVWFDKPGRLLFLKFRHLLKPSTKFGLTEELEECFGARKKKIIGLIEDGVRSFAWVLIGAKMELVGFCSKKLVIVMQLPLSVA